MKTINGHRYILTKRRTSGINTYQKVDEDGEPVTVKQGTSIIDHGILLIRENIFTGNYR